MIHDARVAAGRPHRVDRRNQRSHHHAQCMTTAGPYRRTSDRVSRHKASSAVRMGIWVWGHVFGNGRSQRPCRGESGLTQSKVRRRNRGLVGATRGSWRGQRSIGAARSLSARPEVHGAIGDSSVQPEVYWCNQRFIVQQPGIHGATPCSRRCRVAGGIHGATGDSSGTLA